MNSITYSKFNEKPEYYMKEIFKTKEDAVILKNGKPYLKIFPVDGNNVTNPLKDSIVFENDLIEPIDIEWESNN